MANNQKIAPSSSNKSSSCSSTEPVEHNLEGIILSSFKLKPAGIGATRNTLVENDSLSSYSWPEETDGGKREAGEKIIGGASGDSSINGGGTISMIAIKSSTVVNIENDQHGRLHEPTYVEAYMKFMYWTCVSPFNPFKGGSGHDARSQSDLILKMMQKMLFSAIIGFSFVQSFFQVKFVVVLYMGYPDMESFIDMMFHLMNAGTKVYYVYIFVILQRQFSDALNSLDKLRHTRLQSSTSDCNKNFTMQYAIKLGISSISLTFIQTVWYSGVTQWTPRKIILYHSYSTALGLFLWSKENVTNGTWFENMEHEYGSETNTANILFGAFGMIIHFCSGLHNEAIGDLMQTQAETVKQEMRYLQKQINTTKNDGQNATLAGFLRENGEWSHSRILTQTINACNDTLDPSMKYKHVNNLMLYVFFVLNLFDGDYSVAYLAYLLYGICKSSYTYRIAAEASTLNESTREWICRLAWKSNDDEFLKRVPLLLSEIKAKPIGMGKGQFMINESFIYRFLGWVGSVFVLQAQSREGRAD